MPTICNGLLARSRDRSARATLSMPVTSAAVSFVGDAATRRRVWRSLAGDDGMTTAEYAVGTVAACGFGTVLYQILTSDTVAGLLGGLIQKALSLVLG